MTQRPVEGDRRATADVAWPETERALEVGIDFDRADAARIYDYLLSGGCNFAVDREQAATILARNPDRGYVCRANRVFLGRVVPRAGRRPVLLDLGSGVPTVGDVREVALASIPTPASPTSTSSSRRPRPRADRGPSTSRPAPAPSGTVTAAAPTDDYAAVATLA